MNDLNREEMSRYVSVLHVYNTDRGCVSPKILYRDIFSKYCDIFRHNNSLIYKQYYSFTFSLIL